MTVQNMIDHLNEVEDKSAIIYFDATPAKSSYFVLRELDHLNLYEDPKGDTYIAVGSDYKNDFDPSLN